MRRILIPCALLLVVVAGCLSGGSNARRTYYSLRYTPNPDHRAPTQYDATLLVGRFTADIAYRRQEIVYRSNPYEFSYYNYKLWAARPDKMLAAMVTDHLRNAELFRDVTNRVGDQLPEYELEGDILAIEELDSSEDQWFAHLTLRLRLVRYSDRQLIAEVLLDDKSPVAGQTPVLVVKTMSEIFEGQMRRLVDALAPHLATAGHTVTRRASAPQTSPGPSPQSPVQTPEQSPTSPPGENPRARLIE